MKQTISRTLQNLSLAFCLAAAPALAQMSYAGLSLNCTKGAETINMTGSIHSQYNSSINKSELFLSLYLTENHYFGLFAEHVELNGPSLSRPDFDEGLFTMGEEPVNIWVQYDRQYDAFRVIFQHEDFLSLFSQMEIEDASKYVGLTPNGWACGNNRWFSQN